MNKMLIFLQYSSHDIYYINSCKFLIGRGTFKVFLLIWWEAVMSYSFQSLQHLQLSHPKDKYLVFETMEAFIELGMVIMEFYRDLKSSF